MWNRSCGRRLASMMALLLPVAMGCTEPTSPPAAPSPAPKVKVTDAPIPVTAPPTTAAQPNPQSITAESAAKHAALQEYHRLAPPDAKMFPGLEQVSEDCDVWLDKEKKRVVLRGNVCLREGPLELLACIYRWLDDKSAPQGKLRRGTKEYESVLTVNTSAAVVHSALLLTGAKPGSPVRYEPKYQPANGTEIEITLHWTDAEGKPREAKAQDWVQNFKTKQAMSHNWVFAGSGFVGDKEKGQQQYQGENGNLICVANFTDAVLDVPVPSTATNDALLFAAFTDRIPSLGTPVTIVLTPKSAP
ncbi:MAG: YdjY domain-containing protein [Planctomycetes bacterium]|nr:YdjY domain-containing protein [Planctomycetota bacterium]